MSREQYSSYIPKEGAIRSCKSIAKSIRTKHYTEYRSVCIKHIRFVGFTRIRASFDVNVDPVFNK
jgi:hypothetical protein